MKKQLSILALGGAFLALATNPAVAGVSIAADGSITLTSPSWSGSPALPMFNPNSGNSVDGNLTDAVFFKPGSSFTLGGFEFYNANGGVGASSIGTYSLSLYDLTSSFTLPAGNPLYTFNGSEANLLSSGLSFTTTVNTTFELLTFTGADQVSLTSGDSYMLVFSKLSGDNLIFERGPATANQALGLATVAPGSGVAINNVPAGANRTPVAAFYAAPVPEPTSLALLSTGLAMFAMKRRSRK